MDEALEWWKTLGSNPLMIMINQGELVTKYFGQFRTSSLTNDEILVIYRRETYSIGYYLIRYFATNRQDGHKTEVCQDKYHPLNDADLRKFANIKCGIYNYTFTTEKIKEN